MKGINTPKTRNEKIVVQEFDGELLVYDIESNKAFCLNQTATMIWKNCDGKRNVHEIAQNLQDTLKKPVYDEIVWLAIDQFGKDNLLQEKFEGVLLRTNKMSRRDVIRRIGLASTIVLPLVTSLVVPRAASAASCQGACTTLGQNPCNGNASCTCLGFPGSLTCQ